MIANTGSDGGVAFVHCCDEKLDAHTGHVDQLADFLDDLARSASITDAIATRRWRWPKGFVLALSVAALVAYLRLCCAK